MSRKPSKPETRIEDYLDVMTGGDATLPQPILRIEFYYAFLAGMTVELPQPILDNEKLLAKICGMEVEAPTYIPGLSPRLYAYMAKKGGQDVQVPDPILRLERYWYDYSASTPTPSEQEYTGAVPVTFVADGTPLLDLLISGNEEHSGTPTPDNPVMPQGTGERTGNLFSGEFSQFDNVGGTGDIYTYFYIPDDFTLTLIAKDTHTIPDNVFLGITNDGGQATGGYTWAIPQRRSVIVGDIFTVKSSTSGYHYVSMYRKIEAVLSWIMEHYYVMLNTGSTALPYEPYGVKIPISSANTTTPVYLGEVETTRKIRKLVLTGEENIWKKSSTYQGSFYNALLDTPSTTILIVCSHAVYTSQISYTAYVYGKCAVDATPGQAQKNLNLFLGEPSWSVNDFQQYLAAQYANGTPVTVWYVLATEGTAVVNEPLMKIGDYADTLSMEQAGVSIPTADGSTTLDVETTVKPSEVYIKYLGEAVATLSALPAEVSSPEETPEEVNPEETEEEENEC